MNPKHSGRKSMEAPWLFAIAAHFATLTKFESLLLVDVTCATAAILGVAVVVVDILRTNLKAMDV